MSIILDNNLKLINAAMVFISRISSTDMVIVKEDLEEIFKGIRLEILKKYQDLMINELIGVLDKYGVELELNVEPGVNLNINMKLKDPIDKSCIDTNIFEKKYIKDKP
jgi:hypothetical protein